MALFLRPYYSNSPLPAAAEGFKEIADSRTLLILFINHTKQECTMKVSFSSMRTGAWAVVGVLAATLLVSSCKKSNDNNNTNTPAAGVMAFNLASDIPGASITLSGNLLTQQPLAYNSFTGGYLGVFAGSRQVEAFNYGTGASLATGSFDFAADKYYSIFLVGKSNSYRTVIVPDDLDSTQSAGGQTQVRYINAIPDSTHPTVTVAAGGSNVINEPASFGSVSSFRSVTPGSVAISVTNGGNINVNRTITLDQHGVYTVLLTGVPGSTAADSLSIRFIKNGTNDEAAAKSSASSARSVN